MLSRATRDYWHSWLSDAVFDCVQGNMRMMVDAEQSYMQPAIDALVIHLQQHYNRTAPTVFNTYQCYLRDAPMR